MLQKKNIYIIVNECCSFESSKKVLHSKKMYPKNIFPQSQQHKYNKKC